MGIFFWLKLRLAIFTPPFEASYWKARILGCERIPEFSSFDNHQGVY